jgi:cytochrome c oxidase cbb3-type subunit 3
VHRVVLAMIGTLLFGAAIKCAPAQDNAGIVNHEMAKPVIRGGIVFKAYCILCHGERGDGTGRAAKLYSNLHLVITPHPPEYYGKIIRQGGQAVGGSEFMPPWQDELSQEQIGDVIAYLAIINDAVHRGEVLYKTNCILCHGVQADGKGRAAILFHPPPANLTTSDKDDRYKIAIIESGSKAMGRSQGMPPWEGRIAESDIEDIVRYLRTIVVAH